MVVVGWQVVDLVFVSQLPRAMYALSNSDMKHVGRLIVFVMSSGSFMPSTSPTIAIPLLSTPWYG
jgi:hypothetical protein